MFGKHASKLVDAVKWTVITGAPHSSNWSDTRVGKWHPGVRDKFFQILEGIRNLYRSRISAALSNGDTTHFPVIAKLAKEAEAELALDAIRISLESGRFPYTGWPAERPSLTWATRYLKSTSWGIDMRVLEVPGTPPSGGYNFAGTWGPAILPATLNRLRRAASKLRS